MAKRFLFRGESASVKRVITKTYANLLLEDYSLSSFHDEAYFDHPGLNYGLPRGYCLVIDPETNLPVWVLRGMRKFDYEKEAPRLSWINHGEELLFTEKANGRCFHLSCFIHKGVFFWMVGSKNVHLIFNKKEDLDTYEGVRFGVCKELALQWLTFAETFKNTEPLKQFMIESSLTFIGESLVQSNQHIVKYDHDFFQFFGMTTSPIHFFDFTDDLDLLAHNHDNGGILTSPIVWYSSFDLLGLPRVDYHSTSSTPEATLRNLYASKANSEGAVVYVVSHGKVVGIFKHKNHWYIILRRLREQACHQKTLEEAMEGVADLFKKDIVRKEMLPPGFLEDVPALYAFFLVNYGEKFSEETDRYPLVLEEFCRRKQEKDWVKELNEHPALTQEEKKKERARLAREEGLKRKGLPKEPKEPKKPKESAAAQDVPPEVAGPSAPTGILIGTNGIPGSGKTSMLGKVAAELFPNSVYIDQDMFADPNDPSTNPLRFIRKLKELAEGAPHFVFVGKRLGASKAYREVLKTFKGWRVVFFDFSREKEDVMECFSRILQREKGTSTLDTHAQKIKELGPFTLDLGELYDSCDLPSDDPLTQRSRELMKILKEAALTIEDPIPGELTTIVKLPRDTKENNLDRIRHSLPDGAFQLDRTEIPFYKPLPKVLYTSLKLSPVEVESAIPPTPDYVLKKDFHVTLFYNPPPEVIEIYQKLEGKRVEVRVKEIFRGEDHLTADVDLLDATLPLNKKSHVTLGHRIGKPAVPDVLSPEAFVTNSGSFPPLVSSLIGVVTLIWR